MYLLGGVVVCCSNHSNYGTFMKARIVNYHCLARVYMLVAYSVIKGGY